MARSVRIEYPGALYHVMARVRRGGAAADGDRRMSHLPRGWYWGSQAFGDKLLARVAKVNGAKRKGRSYRGAAAQRALDEHSAEEIRRTRLKEEGLAMEVSAALPGSDARKVRIVRRIRAETTVRMGWIAERLQMRSAANVSQILRRK